MQRGLILEQACGARRLESELLLVRQMPDEFSPQGFPFPHSQFAFSAFTFSAFFFHCSKNRERTFKERAFHVDEEVTRVAQHSAFED